jgi:methylenetetrahydrofolate dehydrogenase (NADP+)/methenyltetrahydrofolate cyclohydrolase
MKILDGKAAAAQVLGGVAERAKALAARGLERRVWPRCWWGKTRRPMSMSARKSKKCEAAGMASIHVPLPATITQEALLTEVHRLNRDPRVHGIIVQLPLPKHLNAEAVFWPWIPPKTPMGFTRPTRGGGCN